MKLSIPLRFVIAVIFSVVYIVSVRADESDRVRRLPGQPRGGPAFAQYMGYVTIDSARGKAFYYALVEAQESAETRPLVLWLNGGKFLYCCFSTDVKRMHLRWECSPRSRLLFPRRRLLS